ncbi:MAG: S-methyl-5'-thioadenosine phosphorylase [Candidatus Shapirobacteria bacterium]
MKAEIGIIGGSGFYDLATSLREIRIETPYGPHSGKIALGKISGRTVAFLPRHGREHVIPPHKINYRANIWALKSLGVSRILTFHAVGSLQKEIKPGDFIVLDQFIDRTKGRIDTFYDGPAVTHISSAFPYCPQLRKLAIKKSLDLKIPAHDKGTVVVIQGPRFSSTAESAWFTRMGWHAVNMTEYPEVALAKEQEICYCAVAMATDYDAGLVARETVKPASVKEIVAIFKKNLGSAKTLMMSMVKNWPKKASCDCQHSLSGAQFN